MYGHFAEIFTVRWGQSEKETFLLETKQKTQKSLYYVVSVNFILRTVTAIEAHCIFV
jgi:hypothetical protein